MAMKTDTERPADAPPEGQERPHLGPTSNRADLPDELEFEIAPEGIEGTEADAEQPVDPAVPPTLAPQSKTSAPQRTDQNEPKRRRNDPQRRIDQAVARQREAETNAQRLLRENQELTERLNGTTRETETLKERAEHGEQVALAHWEEVQKRELDIANRDYRAAVEAGDTAAQTVANSKVAAASVELNKIRDWKAAHPAPQPTVKPVIQEPVARQEQQAPVQNEPLDPRAQQFMDSNPWANPGSQQAPNPDFDQEMFQELVSYASSLERRLAHAGRAAEINTEPYFAKLQTHMQAEFPDYDWTGYDDAGESAGDDNAFVIPAVHAGREPPTRAMQAARAQQANGRQPARANGQNGTNGYPAQRMPKMTRNNAVLPANGQAAPSQQRGERMRVEMSDDEKDLAVKQWENGLVASYWRTGKPPVNAAEAQDQWAFRKLPADMQQRALAARRR